VEKDGDDLKYIGSLIYGAIFAERIYITECSEAFGKRWKDRKDFFEKADLKNI
jgi:hypothetical protein